MYKWYIIIVVVAVAVLEICTIRNINKRIENIKTMSIECDLAIVDAIKKIHQPREYPEGIESIPATMPLTEKE